MEKIKEIEEKLIEICRTIEETKRGIYAVQVELRAIKEAETTKTKLLAVIKALDRDNRNHGSDYFYYLFSEEPEIKEALNSLYMDGEIFDIRGIIYPIDSKKEFEEIEDD
jgi:hypothetical protein